MISREEFQSLKSGLGTLEERIARQEVKGKYFSQILQGQRWTFGTIAMLFAALIGVVGFGAFRWYVTEVKEAVESMREFVKERTEELGTNLSYISDRQESMLARVRVLEKGVEQASGEKGISYPKVQGTHPATFLERAKGLLEDLPLDPDSNHLYRNPDSRVKMLGGSLEKIVEKYGEIPQELRDKGPNILKKLRGELEEDARETIDDMIQTIKET